MKKKIKNPLWWSTIVLSLVSFLLLISVLRMMIKVENITNALNNHNMVYNAEEKDVSEKTTGMMGASTSKSSATNQKSKQLTTGDSYIFNKNANGGLDEGLKITVNSVSVDKSLDLNLKYTTEDYTGMIPLVIKTTFENTSNKTIDLTSFSVIDSHNQVGKWVAYYEGVSSEMPDVLTAGQKVELTDVIAVYNEGSIDLTYNGATWKVN